MELASQELARGKILPEKSSRPRTFANAGISLIVGISIEERYLAICYFKITN
jgi:hypothetical protein